MGEERLHADIVGVVLEIHAAEGSSIEAGGTILTIESMKMEIPVPTEWGGLVAAIAVRPGQAVGDGDLLAVVTSPHADES